MDSGVFVDAFLFLDELEIDPSFGYILKGPKVGMRCEIGAQNKVSCFVLLSASPDHCEVPIEISIRTTDPDGKQKIVFGPKRIVFSPKEFDGWGYLQLGFRFEFVPESPGVYLFELLFDGDLVHQARQRVSE